jgi:hypothetical protein
VAQILEALKIVRKFIRKNIMQEVKRLITEPCNIQKFKRTRGRGCGLMSYLVAHHRQNFSWTTFPSRCPVIILSRIVSLLIR